MAAAVPQVTEVLVHFDTTRQQTVQLDLVDAAAAANPNPLQPLALHEAVTEPHPATDGASSAATGGSPPYVAPEAWRQANFSMFSGLGYMFEVLFPPEFWDSI